MRKSTLLTYLGLSMLVFGTLLPFAAFVSVYFMPAKYTSVCTIEVKAGQQPPMSPAGAVESGPPDSHFVADQIEKIQSKAVLLPVIDELNLVDKWSAGRSAKLSKDEAYQQLLKMIKIDQARNTDMLNILATSTDTQEAADIANTVARVYMQARKDERNQQMDTALSELSAEVEKQRQIVKDAADELQKIRQRDNINDPSPEKMADESNHNDTMSSDYLHAKQNYINAKRLLDAAEAKLESDMMDMKIQLVPVRIWDRAVPATSPSRPNYTLFVAGAAALGFVFAICGLVLFIAGLRLKAREGSASI